MKVRIITIISVALALSGCCEEGSGTLVREARAVPRFDRIALDVPGVLRVTQGPASALKIRTDDNLIDQVRTSVRDGSLVIDTDPDECECIEPTELVVEVSSEEIRGLRIDGSGDIVLPGPVDGDELALEIDGSGSIAAAEVRADDVSLEIDGSGDIDLTVDAVRLRSSIEGSGHYAIDGVAAEHDIAIDGSGDVEAFALQTVATRLEIDGSGDCAVAADETLEVTIDGSGNVAYCGEPRLSESIDGSGSVRRANPASCD